MPSSFGTPTILNLHEKSKGLMNHFPGQLGKGLWTWYLIPFTTDLLFSSCLES